MATPFTYSIAARGLATSFSETEMPPDFAAKFRNRFINANGNAEKRRGMSQVFETIAGLSITGLHEFSTKAAEVVLFASGNGTIYKIDETTGVATQVYTGWSNHEPIKSVQFDSYWIFYNGTDRNIYTQDGVTFREMEALMEAGAATSGTITTELKDADITSWVSATDVAVGDLHYNITKNAYAVITQVSGATLTHTAIGSAATGLGRSTVGNQGPGDRYRLIDLVELNIIPTADPDNPDNVGVCGTGTTASVITVSGVDFSTTDIRKGDWVYNVTRAAITQVTAVATAIGVHGITGQVALDSLVFNKSAMPIGNVAHTHYGRLYFVDARDQRKIRVSGANAPFDFSSDAGTIETNTFSFGGTQGEGDTVRALQSFQKYLVIGCTNNIYLFSGTNPVGNVDANGTSNADFVAEAMFPQGLVSRNGLINLGNQVMWVSDDGILQAEYSTASIAITKDATSSQINNTLRTLIYNQAETAPDDIRFFLYSRRSLLFCQIGSELYVYNFAPVVLAKRSKGRVLGSWSLFDGPFANQNCYLVRQNGDLISGGSTGIISIWDQSGVYSDLGTTYRTEYETGWLTMDEPKRSRNIKAGKYIQPNYEVGADIDYTITAVAPWDQSSSDSVSVSTTGGPSPIGVYVVGSNRVGGSAVQNQKYPLRWRGEAAKFNISTNDTKGPDVISKFTIYANKLGLE